MIVSIINLNIQPFIKYICPSHFHNFKKRYSGINPQIMRLYIFSMKKSQIKKEKAKGKLESEEESVKEEFGVKQEEGQVKHEEDGGPKRWFQDSDDDDNQNKWEYLEHHAVIFPDPYLPKGLTVDYSGQKIKLNPQEEQLAWYWCQTMGSDYQTNEIYRKNFEQQFTESIKSRHPQATKLDKFDFTQMKLIFEKQREERKNKPESEKAKIKAEKENLSKFYSYAIVDGTIQKVNGFQIEPPTLFKGRGKHPKAGCLKPRIQPQQLTINLAEEAPLPRCHVPGHSWGFIECKKDSTWLCSYKNDTISSSSTYKYIFLAANSRFKGQNDRKKYEKARRLKRCIDVIRQDYMKRIEGYDVKNKQLGTATYLIDKLALRVGNQKGQDEADTQGCCSLRVQHIQNLPDNFIKLDFLGKDSMRYVNTVKVHPQVWKNIQLFRLEKESDQDLFDKIDAQALNDYLKSQMQGLTAKVFRTYNASITLQQELKKVNLQGLSMEAKFQKYEEANKQVAILCNHQKTVGKKFVENLNKKQNFIDQLKQYLKELQKHRSQFSAKRETIKKEDQAIQIQGLKPYIKKFPDNKEATEAAIKKLESKISKDEKILKKKDEGKQIALGTSKTNYNDPRISVAWCKRNEVRVEKVFPKTLLSKFLWAMYTDADYEF